MANVKIQNDSPVVKLSNATKVGQLVSGSASTSRYVCVAVGQSLNMAARVNGGSLSIRIEPRMGAETKLVSSKPALAELGVTVHDTGNYASVHLSGESPDKAMMGVAAFMAGFVALEPNASMLPLSLLTQTITQGV